MFQALTRASSTGLVCAPVRSSLFSNFQPATFSSTLSHQFPTRPFSIPVYHPPTTKSSTNTPSVFKGLTDIVNEFGGWYPLIGAATTVAITKELFVCNEEALLITNFVVAVFGLYVVAGDSLHQAISEEYDNARSRGRECLKSLAEINRQSIKQMVAVPVALDMFKALKTTYNGNIRAIAQTKNTKARYAAAQEYLKKLQDMKARQDAAKMAAAAAVISGASAHVRRAVMELSDRDRAQILENALDILSGKIKEVEFNKDPIKKLYVDYINKQSKK